MVRLIGLGTYKRMPTRKRQTTRKDEESLEVQDKLCLGKTGECWVDLLMAVVTEPVGKRCGADGGWAVVLGDR